MNRYILATLVTIIGVICFYVVWAVVAVALLAVLTFVGSVVDSIEVLSVWMVTTLLAYVVVGCTFAAAAGYAFEDRSRQSRSVAVVWGIGALILLNVLPIALFMLAPPAFLVICVVLAVLGGGAAHLGREWVERQRTTKELSSSLNLLSL